MAGFVAAGLLRGDHPQVDVATRLDRPPDERSILLDVRTAKEFADGHLPEASNIPVDDLRGRLEELPRDCACLVVLKSAVAGRTPQTVDLTALLQQKLGHPQTPHRNDPEEAR